MKLLRKAEAAQAGALARKMQIDEGVQVARKVDALRKELADMEEQFRTFSERKRAETDSEFGALERKISEMKSEISLLEARRAELLKPLDAERLEIDRRTEEVRKAESEASKVASANETERRKIANDRLSFDRMSKEFALKVRETDENNRKSGKCLLEASERLEKARQTEIEADSYESAKKSDLARREANLASGERELELSKKSLRAEKIEINRQRLLLEDREATLEREINRQKKKKNG